MRQSAEDYCDIVTVLTTQRLIMREMTDADLDDIAALLGDEYVMRYYPRPKTRSEAQRWIDWNRSLYRDHGFGLWAIALRETGEFVGDCGLTIQQVENVDEIEVGYHVRADLPSRNVAEKIGLKPEKHSTVAGRECVIYAGEIQPAA
jgi:RimJ/RimL family protein N-acetyltransferase